MNDDLVKVDVRACFKQVTDEFVEISAGDYDVVGWRVVPTVRGPVEVLDLYSKALHAEVSVFADQLRQDKDRKLLVRKVALVRAEVRAKDRARGVSGFKG